jgi:5-methylcytosine-specific restriction endonuclease McrA
VVTSLFRNAVSCVYCGIKFPPDGLLAPRSPFSKSLDHIVPLKVGGTHSIVNVVICCWECNGKKGSKRLEEWEEWQSWGGSVECVLVSVQESLRVSLV